MRRPRVLIVDDDRLAQAQLADLYRAAGYDADAAGTAAEALARIAQAPPDLVVVDLVLPDLFGTELVARLKADGRLRRVPVLATTSRLDPNFMAASFRAGAADFLYKPLPAPDILERSRVALERAAAGGDPLPAGRGRRDLAALFCDIRGFTAFAARKDPETVVDVLNGLFDRLVAAVVERGGHVDKFIGDALNLASRLQGVAGENEVLLSERARLRAGAAVQVSEPWQEKLKGFADAQLVYRVRALG